MVRGSVPMRVRRRQSDAKWRASVATCYDTLKRVIPNNEKMSKRKISKALILQETEKHINNLETKLKELLEQKARNKGKAVLYQTELGLVEANMDDIRGDFTLRQHNLYLQNCSQRKRSNIPSDMESGLINLRSAVCGLNVIPSECLQQVLPGSHEVNPKKIRQNCMVSPLIEDDRESLENQVENDEQSLFTWTVDKDSEIEALCLPKPRDDVQFVPSLDKLLKTPIKSKQPPKCKRQREGCQFGLGTHEYIYNKCTPSKLDHSEGTSTMSKTSRKTPSKISRKLPFATKTGFTPVKLPSLEDISDQDVPVSPYTMLTENVQRDGIEKVTRELNMEDLLCTESIEYMDLDDEENDVAKENHHTPTFQRTRLKQKSAALAQEKHRRNRSTSLTRQPIVPKETKCRRKLEKTFRDQKVAGEDVPIISAILDSNDSACLDFDGYYLFYQHMAKENGSEVTAVQPVIGHQTSQMWKEMPEDARETYVAMAAVENSQSDSSSNLSDDLIDLELKPLTQNPGVCPETQELVSTDDLNREKNSFVIDTNQAEQYVLDVQLVPCEVEDVDSIHQLGLEVADDQGFFCYQGQDGYSKESGHPDVSTELLAEGWYSQVVPDAECTSRDYSGLASCYTLN